MTRYALFIALTLVLTAVIGWGTYQTARLLRLWQPDRNLLLLPTENVLRVLLVLLCIGLGLIGGLPPTQLGWTTTAPGQDLLIGVVAGATLSGLLTPLSRLAISRWGKMIYSPLVILNVLPKNGRQWLAVLLALLPAITLEELLFRSLLLGGLSPLLPAWLLVWGLALLFGLLHLPQGLLGVIGTALAGIAFAVLFLWRETLLTPLVAHYVADVLQLLQASRYREELAT